MSFVCNVYPSWKLIQNTLKNNLMNLFILYSLITFNVLNFKPTHKNCGIWRIKRTPIEKIHWSWWEESDNSVKATERPHCLDWRRPRKTRWRFPCVELAVFTFWLWNESITVLGELDHDLLWMRKPIIKIPMYFYQLNSTRIY